AERCDKTGFNEERARRIVIEAAEQCGRSNIPSLREPLHPQKLIEELKDTKTIIVCEETGSSTIPMTDQAVLLVGPEGGWSDDEKSYFAQAGITLANIGDFTHRAETAAIVAASKLL